MGIMKSFLQGLGLQGLGLHQLFRIYKHFRLHNKLSLNRKSLLRPRLFALEKCMFQFSRANLKACAGWVSMCVPVAKYLCNWQLMSEVWIAFPFCLNIQHNKLLQKMLSSTKFLDITDDVKF